MINKYILFVLVTLILTACSSQAPRHVTTPPPTTTQGPDLTGVGGVTPQFEPPSRIGNKDYVVFGQPYKVWNGVDHYSEEGTASWYGPGFHGLYTSNGELYDQEGVSAAHKNLPLPSYLKVTNLDNGKQLPEYTIVGSQEANVMERKVSEDSPFGKALMGRKAGDEITVEAPRGVIRYRVDSIER